jgi:hypothetical protein
MHKIIKQVEFDEDEKKDPQIARAGICPELNKAHILLTGT